MSGGRTRKDRILGRVRSALRARGAVEHPGPFEGGRPDPPSGSPVDVFAANLEAADGEVVRVAGRQAAIDWLTSFTSDFGGVAHGETVPHDFRASRPELPPDRAPLAISGARGAIAETGSLVMDARDGRRAQLLSPTHLVIVDGASIFASFREALANLQEDLPSAIGLHSGPSKSRDVGQVLVKGVHGPGRLVALVVEEG